MKQNFNFIMTSFRKVELLLCITCSVLLFSACSSSTVLLANFKNDNIGSPPASTQPVGSLTLNPGSGLITVVSAPPMGPQSANKWALITHPAQPASETELTGNFTKWGLGSYGLLASLHIPSTSGVVTVQFESANPLGSFMHLDFMPEGDVRIDDDSAMRFGTYPKDANFVLSVKLDITETSATVETTLLGTGASGNKTVTVKPLLLPAAKQFGKCKFWIGFQHNSSFFVDDIVVTKKK
ncbi:MAG: hypothetical protein ABI761_18765 [Saprospiraceae bacterium]